MPLSCSAAVAQGRLQLGQANRLGIRLTAGGITLLGVHARLVLSTLESVLLVHLIVADLLKHCALTGLLPAESTNG